MTKKQKDVLIGMILGDAYLQKTGEKNSRLRLEHTTNQKEYLEWKVNYLKNYFQNKAQDITRFNPVWKKTYNYVRIQSYSSPEFGKFQRLFYSQSKKIIPDTISTLLKSPISIAVWFMDDGYYYHRDNMAYIYIPNYDKQSLQYLMDALRSNFDLTAALKKKSKGLVLTFNVNETKKLMEIISEYVIPSMKYKISLNPVSTE
ncbi:hypothetical protein A2690_00200 [Candidatus Roizmanbacteria bacterium RIFCSPHIGHO2_01_FULL_39_12b]|uniref:Homing endonuclease LAGLIDADG domain-containing protein n=1 Tax=Candidatus Roizmanbacteria bacterium RIFCSPHIGHO2_01_FULL_39_12b TaxID=1802030 RepID=A0A1F7GEM1_9BACT|nr:MAG: hypothetical protein A2690_00200 [Candidatus Roizmanbacteria bacterium RIFCSPHIGHO2_01_FULL_39_12b]